MDRLEDQSRQERARSAAAPTAVRKFAFRGSFSARNAQDTIAHPAVREADGLVTIVGPGLQVEVDPRRVDFAVGQDSVTIACGQPRLGTARAGASARDLAVAVQRSPAARWNELGGRFALIHIDLAERRVNLVTDRFGVHPICFSYEAGTLAFSDRADAVPSPVARTLDRQTIFNYVYFHVIAAPGTIFSGVRRVEPAQVVSSDAAGLHEDFWWRPQFISVERRSTSALKARFRDLVRNAVEREATTPHIGSFLSGGTDSSTIAGFLPKILGRQTPTFSIGFDAAGYDEIAYARLAARHFGTQQTEYYITPDDLVRSIPAVAASYDQPFGNSSALPSYYCALQAREAGVDRLLAGDGGDELFGGNLRYAKQKVFEAYSWLPSPVRASLIEPALLGVPGVRRLPLVKKVASYIEQARIAMPDRMETYNLLNRFGARTVFSSLLLEHVDHAEPSALQSRVYARQQATSVVDRMLAYDWRFTLADNDLPKVIGTSSLAGVTVGFPFLDDDLVDFSLQLGPALKVRGLTLRYFFKEALRGFLPDEIIRKRKHGFGLPFGPWLLRSAALHECARGALESLARRGIVRGEFVGELFSTRLREHAGYFGEMIWILMMLEYWIAANTPSFSV